MKLNALRLLILSFVLVGAFSGAPCRGETPSRAQSTAAAVKAQNQERQETAEASSKEAPASEKTPDAKKTSGKKRGKGGKNAKGKDKSAKTQTPASKPKNAPPYYLKLEQKTRRAEPEVVKGLTTDQRFSRRLPTHWSEVDVTDEQKRGVYSVQKAYFLEIAQLEARMERLKKERDEAMLQVLSLRQRAKLEEILKASSAKRGGEVVEIVFDDEEE